MHHIRSSEDKIIKIIALLVIFHFIIIINMIFIMAVYLSFPDNSKLLFSM